VIRSFLFWFLAPWLLVITVAVIATGIDKPGVMPMLWLLMVLIGFAVRAAYIKGKARADAMLAKARKLTRERMAEDAARQAGGAGPRHFNPRGPGQFTSFAFRYGLPPEVLKRQNPPPPALPPPADDR
jgi:hypothetical protein